MEIPFSKTDNLRILNPTRHAFTFKKLFITQNYLITDRFHINLTNLSLSFLNSDMVLINIILALFIDFYQ